VRVSRQKAGENRQAVLDAAARLFRERGLDGAGVAEVTREAGLTHGGFYGQFPGGKDALAAEAVASAFEAMQAFWQGLTADLQPGADSLAAVATAYLSPKHRDHPGYGCPVPALAADAARSGPVLQDAFATGVERLVAVLAGNLKAAGVGPDRAREEALLLLSSLSGALALSRAVATASPALADEVLEAVCGRILARCGSAPLAS
jgi:TetR/AcrR family transcriptional repressor of nem operon